MESQTTSGEKAPQKSVMFWFEPRAFSRYRLRLVRANQMAWQLHAWLLAGLALAVGGIVVAALNTRNYLGDKGALAAVFGLVLVAARFGRSILTVVGVRVTVSDNGIFVMDTMPPTIVPWSAELRYKFAGMTSGSASCEYVDVVWKTDEGYRRYMFGLSPRVDRSALEQALVQHGATACDDLDQFVPAQAIGPMTVIPSEAPKTPDAGAGK